MKAYPMDHRWIQIQSQQIWSHLANLICFWLSAKICIQSEVSILRHRVWCMGPKIDGTSSERGGVVSPLSSHRIISFLFITSKLMCDTSWWDCWRHILLFISVPELSRVDWSAIHEWHRQYSSHYIFLRERWCNSQCANDGKLGSLGADQKFGQKLNGISDNGGRLSSSPTWSLWRRFCWSRGTFASNSTEELKLGLAGLWFSRT